MFAGKGMGDFSAYLFEMDKSASFGESTDWYPNPVQEKKISISPDYIVKKLGAEVTPDFIEEVLGRLLIKVEKKGSEWVLTPPVRRADLVIPEDISEEVGRILGYDKIPSMLPPVSAVAEIPKSFYYEWKIREALAGSGFSEVMTSSFCEKGSVAIEKPLAEDKKYARPDLRSNFEKALKMNVLNAPLLGEEKTCIFEIGRIFTKEGERTALALGVAGPKKKIAGILESAVKGVSDMLGVTLAGETKDGVFECVLDGVLETLAESKKWDISIPPVQKEKFTAFSLFPFIVRDVALFVSPLESLDSRRLGAPPSSEVGVVFPSPESVAKIIRENAGSLVVRGPELFDEFTKDGKKSLAFRLVFQSLDRTLSDEEVNKAMKKVYSALMVKNWEVR
jgi:phenylalanyl-tRNA synthetase beta chain